MDALDICASSPTVREKVCSVLNDAVGHAMRVAEYSRGNHRCYKQHEQLAILYQSLLHDARCWNLSKKQKVLIRKLLARTAPELLKELTGGQFDLFKSNGDVELMPNSTRQLSLPEEVDMRRDIVIYTDGGCRGNPGPMHVAVVVVDGSKKIPFHKEIGNGTNNIAEYKAVIGALRCMHDPANISRITIRSDSQLVVNQMTKKWRVKQAELLDLYNEAWLVIEALQEHDVDVVFEWIPREKNIADKYTQ